MMINLFWWTFVFGFFVCIICLWLLWLKAEDHVEFYSFIGIGLVILIFMTGMCTNQNKAIELLFDI